MKKILFSALAVLSLAACVQEQVMDVPSGGAIEFQGTFVENATRAAQTVTTANLDAFQVWGFVNAPSGVVFKETTVSKNGGAWSYDGTQYWAPDQHYYFAAVAPLSDLWSLNTETADVTGPGVLSFTNNAATDLVYAEKHVQAAGAGQVNPAVALQFQHLLSKVKLTFTNSFPTENIKVNLYNIQMATPETATIDLKEAHTWEDFGADMTLAFVQKEQLASKSSYTTVEEYFILPTACGIQFDLKVFVGDQPVYEGHKTATLPADAFEMGHAYNLSAEINAASLDFDEITFTVDKVEEWVEAPNTSDAAANLIYAAQIGGTYKLTEDVVLDAPVIVPAGVDFVLDLNDKNITSSGDIFEVAGGNLTINGEGTVYAASNNGTPYCAVWAYGDGYVRINGGEYKIGYPAGDYNDLIYAKDNAKIDIYGGYFHNSGSENAFILNIKDHSNADITVYGGTYVNFNPANNRSEGANTNFVAEGYIAVAKGEKYNVVRGTAVATKDALKEAINNPENTTIVFNAPINFDNEALKIRNNVVIDMTNNQFTSGVNQKLYAVNVGGCEAVLDNANINGGGINAWGNAKVTLNSGKVYNNNTNTSRYSIWAYGEETVVTVTGGDFTWSKPNNRLAWVADGATLKIEGGNFAVTGNVPNIPFVNQGFQTSNGGSIIITGGNFGFNPSAYVAEGYVATLSGSIWTVSKQ